MSLLCILVSFSFAAKILEYKFYKSYGEIFYDFSGNGRHAVNGLNSTSDTFEMICTDRGVHSDGTTERITLPPNNIATQSFNLPSVFSLIFWRKWKPDLSQIQYIVFSRRFGSFDIYLQRNSKVHDLSFIFNQPCGKYSSNINKDLLPEEWNMVTFEVSGNQVRLILGLTEVIKVTVPCTYAETSGTLTTLIGANTGDPKSFKGFIWNFVILDQVNVYTSFISSGTSAVCVLGSTCSCTRIVVDSELGTGCIKKEDGKEKNSKGEDCGCKALNKDGKLEVSKEISCSSYNKALCYTCNCNPSSCVDVKGTESCMNTAQSSCKSHEYLISGTCQVCPDSCKTCLSDTTCITCAGEFSIPDTTGCKCIQGTFGASTLTTSTICTKCMDICATCTNSTSCLTCISHNSFPQGSNCICNQKFYMNSTFSDPEGCQPCHSHCLTCQSSLICQECITSGARPKDTEGCNCSAGFFPSGKFNETGSLCLDCHADCSECNNSKTCLGCKALNSAPASVEGCECLGKFYKTKDLNNADACSPCSDTCLTCNGSAYFNCLSCQNWMIDNICFEIQPIGYSCDSTRNCSGNTSAVLRFDFQGSGTQYFDRIRKEVAILKEQSQFVATFDRGVYFFGGAGLQVSLENFTMFGTEFTFALWVNPDRSDFVLVQKGSDLYNVRVSIQERVLNFTVFIDKKYYSTYSESSLIQGSWNHLIVVLNYDLKATSACIHLNGVLGKSVEITTKPFFNQDNSSLFIGSDSNSSNCFKGFIYLMEFYVLDPGMNNLVSSGYPNCQVLPAGLDCIPRCNVTQFSLDGICEDCPSNCKLGCKDHVTCSLCADDYCLECSSYNTESCVVCDDDWVEDQGLCVKCKNTTFYQERSCVECIGLCITCESKDICTSCKNNSSVNKDKECVCDSGYTQDKATCKRKYFTFVFGIFQNNTIWVRFNESLEIKLSQIKLTISYSVLKSLNLVKLSSTLYNLEIELEEIPTENSRVKINFISPIYSTKNSLLLNKTIELDLFVTETAKEEQKIKVEEKKAKKTAETTAYVGASAAGAASLFSGDLNSIFTFLNIAEMIYSVYFFNMEIYSPLVEFLLGLRVHSSAPNIFKYIIASDLGIKLPKKYQKYGFKTNLLLLNCGIQFTFFLSFLAAFLVLFCLSKVNKFKNTVNPIYSYFKFGAFLRLLVQSYFDLLLACFAGLNFHDFSNFLQIFNFLFCLGLLVFLVFSVFGAFLILRKWRRINDEEEKKAFKEKFSVVFAEFDDGPSAFYLFYLIYIVRRLVIVGMIQFELDQFIQLIVSATFSITVKVRQAGLYVFITKCFKSRLMNVLNVLTEMLLAAYFFMMLFKFLPEAKTTWKEENKHCINLIFTVWGVNIGLTTLITLGKIIEIIKRVCKKKQVTQVIPFTVSKTDELRRNTKY